MSFRLSAVLSLLTIIAATLFVPFVNVEGAQTRTRRNFYGMHNLKDGGGPIPEGMNWTRHLVGRGGYVFDWVRGDYGQWVVDAMDRELIPVLRVQNCNGGCLPDAGHPEIVASVIREHLERHRPQYSSRLVYFQLWNEPGDARDFVTPEDFADFLVAAHAGVRRADAHGVFRTMTPGQNGPEWWRRAIRHNPAACQAFDVWATHPYPESYPPHYNHHDGVPYINQVKTIDSYLLDLDAVVSECAAQGSPRRGFPVMITETIYGDHLGIAYEGYPKTTRGGVCTTDGPCDFLLASEYNLAAFTEFWHRWPEVIAVHPFILQNWSWDHFAFVNRGSQSRADQPIPDWCPPDTTPELNAVVCRKRFTRSTRQSSTLPSRLRRISSLIAGPSASSGDGSHVRAPLSRYASRRSLPTVMSLADRRCPTASTSSATFPWVATR